MDSCLITMVLQSTEVGIYLLLRFYKYGNFRSMWTKEILEVHELCKFYKYVNYRDFTSTWIKLIMEIFTINLNIVKMAKLSLVSYSVKL